MLSADFFISSICIIFTLLFILIWAVYFLSLCSATSKFVNLKDKCAVKKQRLSCNLSFAIFFSLIKFSYIYLLGFFCILKNFNIFVFFRHASLETFNTYTCLIILFFFLFLICVFEKYFFFLKILASGIDFFTALWVFFIFTPLSIFSNTLVTLFFFLEFGSISTVYLIISAKDFFNFELKTAKTAKTATPTTYFNSIFFQFWASFFSSILLVYSIIVYYFMFGSTEWSFLNLCLDVSFNSYIGALKYQLLFATYLFIFAVLIKMGVSPFFFFKIEVYKGLPLIILFFYSVFYFFFFFVLTTLIFLYYFSTIVFFLTMFIFFFLSIFTIVFVINLFSLYLLKNFFAMSSLINSIMFFFLIFAYAI